MTCDITVKVPLVVKRIPFWRYPDRENQMNFLITTAHDQIPNTGFSYACSQGAAETSPARLAGTRQLFLHLLDPVMTKI